ncbi:MAG: glutamate--tRNA ligase [Candidatus Taylorbacteria bacterium]|nr:glutamate--tRNA ligase [Candidatus Taylorbacteria bacterium]
MISDLTPTQFNDLAEILFPDVKEGVDAYEAKFPERNIDGAPVTRFCPSPTGVMHIGGVFAALISDRIAHAHPKGVFYLRIEDTDQGRKIEEAYDGIYSAMRSFDVQVNEGIDGKGSYGPYVQSERLDIYRAFTKELVRLGHAYPCFSTPEELDEIRKKQEALKLRPGYYGTWAVGRKNSFADITKNISEKKPYVIRLLSRGSDKNQRKYNDLIKGEITVTENDQDSVLIKSDGFPTYHLAHVVDDHLMKTTLVLRGDEWVSSLPLHLELFAAFGWSVPSYAHIAPILKQDGVGRRKLSKRKDPEAAVSYYVDQGYPTDAVIEYLLNIANSDFEPWRAANLILPNSKFPLRLEKMSKSGALFDLKKLDDVSKNIVGRMSADEVYQHVRVWSQTRDTELHDLFGKDEVYTRAVLNIERGGTTTRKDIGKWNDVREAVGYFFDDVYADLKSKLDIATTLPASVTVEQCKALLSEYAGVYDANLDKVTWFEKLKEFAGAHGFAKDTKEFKADPSKFKGSVGDIAMLLRLALTTKTKTPDLHETMKVMGVDRVSARLKGFIA